jgi:hypothetical protein
MGREFIKYSVWNTINIFSNILIKKMHFNTKYIFNGDAEREIIDKINYNLNQIVSFAIGPDGHGGPIGPQGIFGAAGMRGITGGQGIRCSKWYNQPTAPAGEPNDYDLWIDNSTGEGRVKSYLGQSWNNTPYALFTSGYFEAYSWISGPGGATDKSVIGLKNGIDYDTTSLIISDGTLSDSTYNPNKSKVVISTLDSFTYPIMSFAKSGNVNTGIPSFYWTSTGSASASIGFKTTGNFGITSLKKLTIDSGLARTILNGNGLNAYHRNFSLLGDGDFYFSSNTSIGIGSSFNISSTNLKINNDVFDHRGPTKITSGIPGSYVINSAPASPSVSGGVLVNVQSTADKIFEFNDSTGSPVFSTRPVGSYTSGNHGETIFGSTGGLQGGTAGPFLYHARRVRDIRQGSISVPNCVNYGAPTTSVTIPNVIDLSDVNFWDSDVITVTPEPYTSFTTSGVYVKVPISNLTDNLPLYSAATRSSYKIFLNSSDVSNSNSTRSLQGIVFTIGSINYYQNFGACPYFELTWLGISNTLRLNPRLFYKTCIGTSAFVDFSTTTVSQSNQVIVNYSFTHYFRNIDNDYGTDDIVSSPSGPGSLRLKVGTVTKYYTDVTDSGTLYNFVAGNVMSVSVLTTPYNGFSSGNGVQNKIYKDGVQIPGFQTNVTLVAGSTYEVVSSVTHTTTECCFVGDTKISMADGSTKNIEDILVNDLILTYDPETSLSGIGSVTSIESPIKNDIIEFILSNDTIINATTEHPFWVIDKGWSSYSPERTILDHHMKVAKIEIGDVLIDVNGNYVTLLSMNNNNTEFKKVYNILMSEGNHTYYADGILVHNKFNTTTSPSGTN